MGIKFQCPHDFGFKFSDFIRLKEDNAVGRRLRGRRAGIDKKNIADSFTQNSKGIFESNATKEEICKKNIPLCGGRTVSSKKQPEAPGDVDSLELMITSHPINFGVQKIPNIVSSIVGRHSISPTNK